MKNKNKLLVVDINYLPSEFKDMGIDKIITKLQEMYNRKVFIIDSSKINLSGAQNSNPVFEV